MKRFSYSIEQLAKFCGAQFKGANANAHISQLIIDSRKAKDFSTHLFIAIKGSRHDGHNFIKNIINNRPSLIISEKKLKYDITKRSFVESIVQPTDNADADVPSGTNYIELYD